MTETTRNIPDASETLIGRILPDGVVAAELFEDPPGLKVKTRPTLTTTCEKPA